MSGESLTLERCYNVNCFGEIKNSVHVMNFMGRSLKALLLHIAMIAGEEVRLAITLVV